MRSATNSRRFRRRSQGKNRAAINPKSQTLRVYIDKTDIELRLQEEQASHGYHSSEDVGLITMGFIVENDDTANISETPIDDNTENNDTSLENNNDVIANDTDTASVSIPEKPLTSITRSQVPLW